MGGSLQRASWENGACASLSGLKDALLPAAGDEVPVDMARAVKRLATEQYQPSAFERADNDVAARAQEHQLIATETAHLPHHLDFASDHINRTFDMLPKRR